MVPVLAALAAVWLALIVAAPALPVPIAGVLYALGSFICHQRSDRSFHLFAAQLPVCARCAGIYAGAALGAVAAVLSMDVRTCASDFPPRALLVIGGVPTALTLLLEWSGLWAGSNLARALAGLPLGCAVALVVARAAATVHYARCAPRRPIASSRPPTHI